MMVDHFIYLFIVEFFTLKKIRSAIATYYWFILFLESAARLIIQEFY